VPSAYCVKTVAEVSSGRHDGKSRLGRAMAWKDGVVVGHRLANSSLGELTVVA
jgi:hypothetical protein